ncbi:MAG: TerB family tellurite resistance protein [Kofleriaceae bacterium]
MHPNVARCHLLAEVLASDGMMAEGERELLEREMAQLELSDAERDQVRHFEGRDDALAVVAALPQAERQALVDRLVEAALVDGKLTARETEAVKRIAEACKLDP